MYIVCMACRNSTYPFKPRDRKGSFTTHPNRHCTWCISILKKNNNIFLTRKMKGSLILQVKFVGHGVCLTLNMLGHFSRFFIVQIYYSKKLFRARYKVQCTTRVSIILGPHQDRRFFRSWFGFRLFATTDFVSGG